MTTVTSERMVAKVVSKAEWLAARKELLNKEREFTRLRDELSRRRRELPWEKVDKNYRFDGPTGKQTLADLFDGRSQLIVSGMEGGLSELLLHGGYVRRR
jgi:predicted dithiol-disulfide oxidoreductase (DUF899 family)